MNNPAVKTQRNFRLPPKITPFLYKSVVVASSRNFLTYSTMRPLAKTGGSNIPRAPHCLSLVQQLHATLISCSINCCCAMNDAIRQLVIADTSCDRESEYQWPCKNKIACVLTESCRSTPKNSIVVIVIIISARLTILHRAIAKGHSVCLSVCLSVYLSVCFSVCHTVVHA